MISILDQIKAALADRTATIVARQTGLSRQTVDKFRAGKTISPAHSTVQVLAEYLGIKS